MSEKTARLTKLALLSAIATMLYFVEIPIVAFYKLDFSAVPALLAGFSMGPIAALVVLFIKNIFHLLVTYSAGVGELADFLMSGTLAVTAALFYRHRADFKGALLGVSIGTVLMAIVAALLNYFLIIPFYMFAMGLSQEIIVGMGSAVIPWVDSILKLVVAITIPFNLFKGAVVSALALVLLKYLKPILFSKQAQTPKTEGAA